MPRVRRYFPGLEELTLDLRLEDDSEATHINLTPLADLPGVRVTLQGYVRLGFKVRGRKALGDRLTAQNLMYLTPVRRADE
jgi:hypothetical protein